MLARTLIAAAAVGLAALLLVRLGAETACAGAAEDALRAGFVERVDPARAAAIAADARAHCDPERLASTGMALVAAGEAGTGRALAELAARRGSENFAVWRTLAQARARAGGDVAAAERRARELNPLWTGLRRTPARPADPPLATPGSLR